MLPHTRYFPCIDLIVQRFKLNLVFLFYFIIRDKRVHRLPYVVKQPLQDEVHYKEIISKRG